MLLPPRLFPAAGLTSETVGIDVVDAFSLTYPKMSPGATIVEIDRPPSVSVTFTTAGPAPLKEGAPGVELTAGVDTVMSDPDELSTGAGALSKLTATCAPLSSGCASVIATVVPPPSGP
jgi:hypothetical protein